MRILLIIAGLTLSLAAASQEIWRWVDKDGVVHYADQPGAADAKLVSVVAPNSYEGDATAGYAASNEESDEEDAASPYGSISIVQPTNEQVFFGSNANVTVLAELDGTMQTGQAIMFYVNGNLRPATSGTSLELEGLPRGTHFVRATVIDSTGVAVMSSPQIKFHVRQTSIQNPQNPLRPRPQAAPPRPQPAPAPTPTAPPTRPIPGGT
jgi:Domain of unknown function (DUF4124)